MSASAVARRGNASDHSSALCSLPSGWSVSPTRASARRVQDPHRTAAVLDPHGVLGDERIQLFAVELAGDRGVVADGPDPAVGSRRRPVASACASCAFVRTSRRPDREGVERRGHRPQVQVMVVQSGQHRTGLAHRCTCSESSGSSLSAISTMRSSTRMSATRPSGSVPRRISMWPAWLRPARARAGCRRRARAPALRWRRNLGWPQRFRADVERQRGIARRNLREGDLDDLAAAAPERVEHGLGGRQPGQRVGDRVADEFRIARAPTRPPATAASSPNATPVGALPSVP